MFIIESIMNWVLASERNIVATFIFVDFIFACIFAWVVMKIIDFVRDKVYEILSTYARKRKREQLKQELIRQSRKRRAAYASKRNAKNLAA